MKWITATIAWIYDFLAEDVILLVGTIVALLVAALAAHAVHQEAGVILFVVVVLVMVASLWRTVSAAR